MKALVVGGGLAGLSAAYTLKKSGWQVTVLEAATYPGGRSSTVQHGGYSIDRAATQLSSGYTEYLNLCRELGLSEYIHQCNSLVGIVRDGRIHEIDGSNNLSALLSPVISVAAKFTMLKTVVDAALMRPPLNYLELSNSYRHDNESIRQYAQRRLNTEVFDYIISPLLRGNFLQRPDAASKLDWFGIIRSFAGQQMLAMRGGINRLPAALAAQVDTRLQARVTHIETTGDKVAVRWIENGVEHSELADACVVATRLPEAVQICPAYAQAAGALNRKLTYSRVAVVHLGYTKATRSKVLGVFISAREHARISLVWMDHNKLPESAPEGHSLISCYVESALNDDCFGMTDAELIGIGSEYVERLFPELRGTLDMSRVSRWPLAIPFPETGVYTEIHALRQRLNPQDRIQYAGDYFTCTGQNSAIYYGTQAARHLLTRST